MRTAIRLLLIRMITVLTIARMLAGIGRGMDINAERKQLCNEMA